MHTHHHNLRTRLFFSYFLSLIILAVFFYAAVHFFRVPYNTELFFLLLFVLAVVGFFIIRRITGSLEDLSNQITLISSHNLDTRIRGIHNKDEIGELAHTFNELLDRLHAAFKREQQFIADVAHEMKTPLAVQRSNIELALSRNETKEEYKRALENALGENDRLTSTLKNVLDLAWSESPSPQYKKEKINLTELVYELGDIAEKIALNKKIHIKPNISASVVVQGYKDRLARAILNIIDNAIKYTPHNREIYIELTKAHDKAILRIQDTGPGIASNDIPHIFDRFYRGSKTSKALGSGIGLAITKSVITLHQGTIKVDSVVGEGSTFSITLPIS